MSYMEDYNNNGYVIIDNFLPEETAQKLYDLYSGEPNWEKIDQIREGHYEHVFKTDSEYLPNPGEHYIAKFDRSNALEGNAEFNDIYNNIIKPRMAKLLTKDLAEHDIRCYRLNAGDLYRTHIDDYAADVGLIYYINKRWVWDWGGILHVCNDNENSDNEISSILPKYNRAV